MNNNKRVWEIDFLRGIAVILMITFHLVFDLNEYYSYDVSYLSGFWFYIGKASAILFIIISGISSNFSKNNLNRGFFVLLVGMLLTLITYLINQDTYINFGILHFLGTSMIITGIKKRKSMKTNSSVTNDFKIKKYLNNCYLTSYNLKIIVTIIISIAILIVGNVFSRINIIYPYLFPIGLTNKTFTSLDYYPLFPWFGIFLFGIALGKILYKNKKSLINNSLSYNVICKIGQNSLIVYIIHQPILLLFLYVIHIFIL